MIGGFAWGFAVGLLVGIPTMIYMWRMGRA
jgi:hypothetical protein